MATLAPLMFPMPTIALSVLDLFNKEPIVPAFKKRQHTKDNDPNASLRCSYRIEHQQIETARQDSIFDEEIRRTRENEMAVDVGPSLHASMIEETTPEVQVSESQMEIGA